MSEKVRRILFEGHLLFNISDVAEYLEIGSFVSKMKKAGVDPITLPVLKELGVGDGVNSFWLTWDDLFKMDQKLKWAKTDIGGLGKKLHMLRMWARNKDGQPCKLVNGGLNLTNTSTQSKEKSTMAKATTTKQQPKPAMTVNIVKETKSPTAPVQNLFTTTEKKDTPVPVPPSPEATSAADINLELMSLVENMQIETIKILRDQLNKMEELLRLEQANVQRVTQEFHETIRYYNNNITPVMATPTNVEVPIPVEPVVEISAPPVVEKPKKERKFANLKIPSRKDDPMPTLPKIIAVDTRSGHYVRERLGDGYLTSKIFLQVKGKKVNVTKGGKVVKRYNRALSQFAQNEMRKQHRENELYSVPGSESYNGKSAEKSYDVAFPIDILEKVLPKVKFD